MARRMLARRGIHRLLRDVRWDVRHSLGCSPAHRTLRRRRSDATLAILQGPNARAFLEEQGVLFRLM
jgi:hypothetical protein